jgi:hypothetical protein
MLTIGKEEGRQNISLAGIANFVSEATKKKAKTTPIRLVIDSITDIAVRFSENEAQRFVADVYDLLKPAGNITALFTVTGSPSTPLVETLGSLVDGIIQIRQKDSEDDDGILQQIRIYSVKSNQITPKWTRFRIENGSLQFGKTDESNSEQRCKLCNGPITGEAASSGADSPFHPKCLDTYRKLGDIYGSSAMYSLQPGVVTANFFFVDIVGLSDPLLTVENQIRKIKALNSSVASCEAFSKVSRNDKIILPTGDGMAIGFLMNPELPLQLSIQLHRKLLALNEKSSTQNQLAVRIGLSSGPVFVVNDINDNQNVWGPGIVLGRRVMDLGDSNHILLADSIGEALRNLKDDYKEIIRLVSHGHKVKHGEVIKLYSAVGKDFGNPATPSRILLQQQ